MKIVKPTPTCPEDETYIKYIDEHRNNVYTAFLRFGKTICLSLSMVSGEYDILRRYVYSHDVSKFGKEEFQGYRQWFFPKEGEEKDKEAFIKAWHHHYTANSHHWEYFMDNGKVKPMRNLNVAEMLLDWIAMSMKFKNSPVTWYEENKDRIVLDKETRKKVENTLTILSRQPLYPFAIRRNNRRHQNKK